MYVLRLWFASERTLIARAELEPYRQRQLAEAGTDREREIINEHFDAAVGFVAHKIHPLRILGILK